MKQQHHEEGHNAETGRGVGGGGWGRRVCVLLKGCCNDKTNDVPAHIEINQKQGIHVFFLLQTVSKDSVGKIQGSQKDDDQYTKTVATACIGDAREL